MVKALRRMGLAVVPRDATAEQEECMSGRDVKQVTEVARDVAAVGKRAREVAGKLRSSIDEVHEALDVADGLGDALRAAGAELRGALGVQTNNPPEDPGENEGGK